MLTFRLKNLFYLALVVGMALMWGKWYRSTEETACRLLTLKRRIAAGDLEFTEAHQRFVKNMESPLVSRLWRRKINLWMECSVIVQFNIDGRVEEYIWTADWPKLETKARQEKWDFYRQVIVSSAAALTIGWTVRAGNMGRGGRVS